MPEPVIPDSPTGLLAAMLAVQGAMETMPKDRTVKVQTKTGGEYEYSYTPLDTIVEKIQASLFENGLVWTTLPGRDQHGDLALRYRLAHAPTGEVLEGEMPLLVGMDVDAQGLGSAITYMRRYALTAVLNIVADTDDDGAGAGRGRTSGASTRTATGKQLQYLRSLATRAKVQPHELVALLRAAGVTVPDDTRDLRPVVDALTSAQASQVIEALKEGPVPTGQSDVPSEGAPVHEPTLGDEFDPTLDVGPS